MHEFITLIEAFGQNEPGAVLKVLHPGDELEAGAVDAVKAKSLVEQHGKAMWGTPEAATQVAPPAPRRRVKHG